MKNSFEDLKLCPQLIEGLKKQGITLPTPIQALTFPAFLEGKNLIAASHTGSGKTLAFLLPLFEKMKITLSANQAIILAPTHELAIQIYHQAKQLAQNSGLPIESALIIGDVSIEHQIKKLKNKPQLIVGSAGRILDLISRKKITAETIHTVILDEADNLLAHNQSTVIKKLLHLFKPNCQLALFSASISESVKDYALPLLKDPVFLSTSEKPVLSPNIDHYYMQCEQRHKFDCLKRLLQTTNAQRALVFVSQHTDTKTLMEKLIYHGFKVGALSGKLSKEERQSALNAFKNGKVNVLLSSDLSARGLDVAHISYVIHYDLPLTPEDYLHRAGRTGRNNQLGASILMLDTKDPGICRLLQREYCLSLDELILTKGKLKNVKTGTYLVPDVTLKAPAAKSKNKNKYPKGFTKPKASPSAFDNLPETGSLEDALRLIEEAGFND